jgi:hypothetical protein
MVAASLLTVYSPAARSTGEEPPKSRCPFFAYSNLLAGTRSNSHAFNSFRESVHASINKLAATVRWLRGSMG